jgi:hypothetical protein
MPAFSKDTAPNVLDVGPAVDWGGELAGYTADFVTIRQAHSLAAMLKGLPAKPGPRHALGVLSQVNLAARTVTGVTATATTAKRPPGTLSQHHHGPRAFRRSRPIRIS